MFGHNYTVFSAIILVENCFSFQRSIRPFWNSLGAISNRYYFLWNNIWKCTTQWITYTWAIPLWGFAYYCWRTYVVWKDSLLTRVNQVGHLCSLLQPKFPRLNWQSPLSHLIGLPIWWTKATAVTASCCGSLYIFILIFIYIKGFNPHMRKKGLYHSIS